MKKNNRYTCARCGSVNAYELPLAGVAGPLMALLRGSSSVAPRGHMTVPKFNARFWSGFLPMLSIHGLIEREPATTFWRLTAKGKRFMKGSSVPRVALVKKSDHSFIRFVRPTKDRVTLGDV